MPSCPICDNHSELSPDTEIPYGLNFPIKIWHCKECHYKRWLHSKKDFNEWEIKRAEIEAQPKKTTTPKRRKVIFYSLIEKPCTRGTEYKYASNKDAKCSGCANCSCGTDKNKCSGGCSNCGTKK